MKILFVNGSPHAHGTTARAIEEMERTVRANGLTAERFFLGDRPILSCIACGLCKTRGKCFYDDPVNELAELARGADGFVFATPVHYAGASGALKSCMGRLFFSAAPALAGKPAVALAAARRGGNVAALGEIEKFFTFCGMPIVSGNYWCILHGTTPEEAEQDEEGLQTLRLAAENLVFLVRAVAAARENGVPLPKWEEKIKTSYIR